MSEFDRKMYAYLAELRAQTLNRRRFIKGAAGASVAAAAMAGATPFLPGISVLAQDETTITFGLESDVRGVEPALG
jgi:hypothetical protein